VAEPLYDQFVTALKAFGVAGATRRVAPHKQVVMVKDGPPTLVMDTP
jgi:D-Tyr-tRNAtyr deacylase